MVVQTSNQSDESNPSTEPRPLNHDDFFTGTFKQKRLAKAFLRIMLPSELLACLDLDGLTAEPRHITDELFKTLVADVIYRVPIKATDKYVDFFVIAEHKSFNDAWTIFQLWCYVFYIVRQEFKKAKDAKQVNAGYQLPPVIAIILHHGRSRFTGKMELSELFVQLPGIEKYLPKLQAILVDLNTINDDDIPDDPNAPELKLVLMALKIVFRKDAGTKIKEILEELKSVDPVLQEAVRMVWFYFFANAEHMERDFNILYETIKKIVEVEPMPTMLEKWTAEAVAKGKAEGKAEGEAKGKAEAGRNMVLTVLRKKFKKVPKGIEKAVLGMSDPIALESLLEHALDSETMDEFATALQ
jgi:hypothetical protein